jgi:hypothetical protein
VYVKRGRRPRAATKGKGRRTAPKTVVQDETRSAKAALLAHLHDLLAEFLTREARSSRRRENQLALINHILRSIRTARYQALNKKRAALTKARQQRRNPIA